MVKQLGTILPLTNAAVSDVQAGTRRGTGGQWNQLFSPVQGGKEHPYHLLRGVGLTVQLREGWQTNQLREEFGLKRTRSKSRQSFDSHTVD
ncbi:MAG TPA: hypothetical protein VF026_10545 [Ktedonobacteraceae bacterium]